MNRKVSVAPMMDCTDRHERFFLRLISKNTLLYTEMIVDEAINRGDKKKLLEFNINEKPVSTNASKAIESSMGDESFKLTAEGKVNYAKSLPFLLKGIKGTIRLRPETQAMVSNIQSNPMMALKELGGLSKVIPNVPKYISTLTNTSKLVITGAKAKKIEGSDSLDKAMNDLTL